MNARPHHLVTLSPCHLVMPLAILIAAASACAQPARADTPAPIVWSAKDSQQHDVAIPAKQTTLLLFLRPGQEQSQDELKLLTAALKNRTDLQIVTILSGDEATRNATTLAADPQWGRWPLVLDPQYQSSGKFGVRVWPTTVVVSAAGEQIAHLPGLPINLENDLGAYLDFAAKKIERNELDKRLADRQVVADSQDQKAARHVEVAQRLAGKGMVGEAAKELASALALAPKDPSVLLLIARTQLVIGEPKSAEPILAKLAADSAGSLPPHQINLLKGWSAVLQERWDDARAILLENEKLNPDPAETFYLLGRIYQHDGDAQKAGVYFRKAFEHSPMGKAMGAAG